VPGRDTGCAGDLSVPVAEAVPACVQTTQVQAGKGEQEETSLRKIWLSSAQVPLVAVM